MLEIDKSLVSEIIKKEIGIDYQIDDIQDTTKYVFIYWRHKKYDSDDERGSLIGVGPVVYEKTTKKYKLLGSGDLIVGDYLDFINENDPEYEEEIPSIPEIKLNVTRRKYVNSSDIGFIGFNLNKELGTIDYYSTLDDQYESQNHEVIVSDNKNIIKIFIDFWNDIGFKYILKSESEIILFKEK